MFKLLLFISSRIRISLLALEHQRNTLFNKGENYFNNDENLNFDQLLHHLEPSIKSSMRRYEKLIKSRVSLFYGVLFNEDCIRQGFVLVYTDIIYIYIYNLYINYLNQLYYLSLPRPDFQRKNQVEIGRCGQEKSILYHFKTNLLIKEFSDSER